MNINDLLIYRDGLILAINKPSGMPVHKGSGRKDIVPIENYFDKLQFGLPKPPKLAHRLDKDTSGCLVLGRNLKGLNEMGRLFENNLVTKEYIALVEGIIENNNMIIQAKIAPKSTDKNSWWVKICEETGKDALTELEVIQVINNSTLVRLRPKTGRTHQLRIHMQHIGHPIIGDAIYGNKNDDSRLMLHAHTITFKLYKNKPAITITAPLPEEFNRF